MAKSSTAARTLNLKAHRVVIAGVGPFKQGEIAPPDRIAAAGIDPDRLAQLVGRGDLEEVWE